MYFLGSFLKSFRQDLQHNFTSCPSCTKVWGFISPLSLISSSVTTQVLSGYGFGFLLSAAWRVGKLARVKSAAAMPERAKTVMLFIMEDTLPLLFRSCTSFLRFANCRMVGSPSSAGKAQAGQGHTFAFFDGRLRLRHIKLGLGREPRGNGVIAPGACLTEERGYAG